MHALNKKGKNWANWVKMVKRRQGFLAVLNCVFPLGFVGLSWRTEAFVKRFLSCSCGNSPYHEIDILVCVGGKGWVLSLFKGEVKCLDKDLI